MKHLARSTLGAMSLLFVVGTAACGAQISKTTPAGEVNSGTPASDSEDAGVLSAKDAKFVDLLYRQSFDDLVAAGSSPEDADRVAAAGRSSAHKTGSSTSASLNLVTSNALQLSGGFLEGAFKALRDSGDRLAQDKRELFFGVVAGSLITSAQTNGEDLNSFVDHLAAKAIQEISKLSGADAANKESYLAAFTTASMTVVSGLGSAPSSVADSLVTRIIAESAQKLDAGIVDGVLKKLVKDTTDSILNSGATSSEKAARLEKLAESISLGIARSGYTGSTKSDLLTTLLQDVVSAVGGSNGQIAVNTTELQDAKDHIAACEAQAAAEAAAAAASAAASSGTGTGTTGTGTTGTGTGTTGTGTTGTGTGTTGTGTTGTGTGTTGTGTGTTGTGTGTTGTGTGTTGTGTTLACDDTTLIEKRAIADRGLTVDSSDPLVEAVAKGLLDSMSNSDLSSNSGLLSSLNEAVFGSSEAVVIEGYTPVDPGTDSGSTGGSSPGSAPGAAELSDEMAAKVDGWVDSLVTAIDALDLTNQTEIDGIDEIVQNVWYTEVIQSNAMAGLSEKQSLVAASRFATGVMNGFMIRVTESTGARKNQYKDVSSEVLAGMKEGAGGIIEHLPVGGLNELETEMSRLNDTIQAL